MNFYLLLHRREQHFLKHNAPNNQMLEEMWIDGWIEEVFSTGYYGPICKVTPSTWSMWIIHVDDLYRRFKYKVDVQAHTTMLDLKERIVAMIKNPLEGRILYGQCGTESCLYKDMPYDHLVQIFEHKRTLRAYPHHKVADMQLLCNGVHLAVDDHVCVLDALSWVGESDKYQKVISVYWIFA